MSTERSAVLTKYGHFWHFQKPRERFRALQITDTVIPSEDVCEKLPLYCLWPLDRAATADMANITRGVFLIICIACDFASSSSLYKKSLFSFLIIRLTGGHSITHSHSDRWTQYYPFSLRSVDTVLPVLTQIGGHSITRSHSDRWTQYYPFSLRSVDTDPFSLRSVDTVLPVLTQIGICLWQWGLNYSIHHQQFSGESEKMAKDGKVQEYTHIEHLAWCWRCCWRALSTEGWHTLHFLPASLQSMWWIRNVELLHSLACLSPRTA